MNRVGAGLWLGNRADLWNPTALFSNKIANVVDLAIEEPVVSLPRRLSYVRLPWYDGAGNPKAKLELTLRVLLLAIQLKEETLVACSYGMSRSPIAIAAALSIHNSSELNEELKQVAKLKSLDVHHLLLQEVAAIVDELKQG